MPVAAAPPHVVDADVDGSSIRGPGGFGATCGRPVPTEVGDGAPERVNGRGSDNEDPGRRGRCDPRAWVRLALKGSESSSVPLGARGASSGFGNEALRAT